jgi:hypothetical protein
MENDIAMALLAACAKRLSFPRFRIGAIHTRVSAVCLAVCLAAAVGNAGRAWGQAVSTADRRSAIAVYGLGSYMRPEFSQPANIGYGAGADATPFLFRRFEPSLELRITGNSGSVAKEFTYSGGAKVGMNFRGIHPYGLLMDGVQTIYLYTPRPGPKGLYAHDSSQMFTIGGGAEYDLGPTWQVRLDYAKQYWKLNSPGIRPEAISVGITYRIPFRERNSGLR